ncbi:hypothetical protein ACFSFZ_08735 [Mixta tenebrionis]|uniref:Uncharacterized protein n=1 Tax=Mixta tenebrionis TaxID=2562439 RepID=A0A506VD43_9GAMM|nr:hypothetical protein [Mixta tenebrionis]TPW42913.1 hypothetical protein FKM52_09090 [Mixta tenebrionis]
MMKTILYFLIILYSVMGHSMTYVDNSQNEKIRLPDSIRSGNFDSIEIACVPSTIKSVIRINQDNLQNGYFYKVILEKLKTSPYWNDLINHLNETEMKKVDDLKDLRCAINFLNEREKIFSIYYDKKGKYGAINSTPVVFKGGLYDWVNKNFPNLIN